MTDLAAWRPCSVPENTSMKGRFVRADLFDATRDAQALFHAIAGPQNDALWTYIPFGPLDDAAQLAAMFSFAKEKMGWRTYLFRSPQDEVLGTASYMRIRPEHGSAEIGSVIFSNQLKRTPAATEAMYLMAHHLFVDLGYRRYEWKCDVENEASKRAAARLGFSYEGCFRQDMVVKGRNRDTCWFSMLDSEWPQIKNAFEAWLAPENFDCDGVQKHPLAAFRA